jgi:hypothetical protein
MNMDETKLYSWFPGPKAENADMLERLVLEALRDCVFWRRNFHPEDDIIVTEKCKREDAFQDSQALDRFRDRRPRAGRRDHALWPMPRMPFRVTVQMRSHGEVKVLAQPNHALTFRQLRMTVRR